MRRALLLPFATLLAGSALAGQAVAQEPPECLPDGAPPVGAESCVSCLDELGERIDCDDDGDPLLVAFGVGVMLAWWILPAVLVYRAAERRGMDAGALTWSWLIFGGLGLAWTVFRSIPRSDEEPQEGPVEVGPVMRRATDRLAARRARRRR